MSTVTTWWSTADGRPGRAEHGNSAEALGGAPDRLEDRIAALTGTVSAFGEEWAVDPDQLDLAAADRAAGDAPVVVVSRTNAYRVRASGLAERFVQFVLLVRRPEQALAARGHSVTYSPGQQRVSVLRARLMRRSSSGLLAEVVYKTRLLPRSSAVRAAPEMISAMYSLMKVMGLLMRKPILLVRPRRKLWAAMLGW